MNLQESIRRILMEETKPSLFLRRRFTQEEIDELVFNLEYTFNKYQMDQKHMEDVIDADVNEFIVNSRYYSDFMDLDDQKYWEIYNQYRNPLIDYLKSKLSMVDDVKQELDEYARTLKNARRHGTKLRFPKSAIKANPQRFRKYTRDSIQESDPKVGTGKKPEGYIRRILREDVSNRGQEKLNEMIKTLGVVTASKAVGGFENLSKVLNLDLNDLKTQEMLVKNFIYFANKEYVDILHLEINRDRPDKVRIKIHFDTNLLISNMESWLVRTLCDEMNKFFTFKTAPYWEPAFAGRGVTVVLDSEQIVNDDEDEINLQETELTERCWKGYTQKGMKTMFGKRYPNCVKKTK